MRNFVITIRYPKDYNFVTTVEGENLWGALISLREGSPEVVTGANEISIIEVPEETGKDQETLPERMERHARVEQMATERLTFGDDSHVRVSGNGERELVTELAYEGDGYGDRAHDA